MSFQLEAEMTPTVRRWLHEQGLAVKEEFSVPWGVCDLVGVALNPNRVSQRLRLGQRKPIGPPRRIALLDMIPDIKEDRAVTLGTIARQSQGYSFPNGVESELALLIKSRFVVSPRRNHFQKVNGWAPIYDRIVAVELKLNRVAEALHQSAAHLWFAGESYAAFPERLAHSLLESQRASEFAERGVGIIAVSRKRCDLLLRSACIERYGDSVLADHCAERFWHGYVKGN